MKKKIDEAQDMIKSVYEDGEAEINGRVYTMTSTTHTERRKVFAFFSTCNKDISEGDFSFLDSKKFEAIEKIINNTVLFEGCLLSRMPDHWEKYPEDYVIFVNTMMGSMSYPFFRGVVGS